MQLRLQDSDQKFELMQRLNQNLAFELGSTLDELDALKRTVVDSKSLAFNTTSQDNVKNIETENDLMPSFMLVMQAEQTLVDNFVYESEQNLSSNLQRNLRAMPMSGVKRLDDSSEIEAENENSIPQESSIAANVSFQNQGNQRRATGTLLAQNQRNISGGSGMQRGKSTPVLNSNGAAAGNNNSQTGSMAGAPVYQHPQQQMKGNQNPSHPIQNIPLVVQSKHPTMVGGAASSGSIRAYHFELHSSSASKATNGTARRTSAKKQMAPKPLPPLKLK